MASTKDIYAICNDPSAINKTFCLQTLTAYPPAVSAKNMDELVRVTLDLGTTLAKERAGFVAGLKKEATFKKYFETCNDSYSQVVNYFESARSQIDEKPHGKDGASLIILESSDYTQLVKDTIGKNTDKTSKRLMEMTLVMEDFIHIAFAAINYY
ncbi:Plant invertase/pectin methylesterase inhibitor superfamily protein [Raphanus sativus]|nr:Plant invertase/pectin methylesterase inhibitor superfamily protein [Raphanus sativus]